MWQVFCDQDVCSCIKTANAMLKTRLPMRPEMTMDSGDKTEEATANHTTNREAMFTNESIPKRTNVRTSFYPVCIELNFSNFKVQIGV